MLFDFDTYNILAALFMSLAIQAVFFIFAAAFKTDKVTDFSYGLSFIILTLAFLMLNETFFSAQILVAACIILWGARLGSYLFMRILRIGKDYRFNDRRGDFGKFLRFWIFQALTVWCVMLPNVLFLSMDSKPVFNWVSVLGITLWAAGFVIEIVSDTQKYAFKSKPGNRGRWISTGLWKYSRHPNYFGESLLWWGLFLAVIPSLNGLQYFAVAGPIVITLLLLFVTGIPLLERSADARYGVLDEYKDYKRKTSIFIPRPPLR